MKAEAYGSFAEEPTRPELERIFFLDDVDRDLIALRRTEHHRARLRDVAQLVVAYQTGLVQLHPPRP
ncbi:DUF4158 domain-containing protein [Streptomyces sp. NPDC023723]|uniref:DUF4158 domain-containing protein n=1 Tax=Streptomyces sp. NPDC023723 TaxID=3154323 RepID=UPI0033E10018